MEFTLPLDPVGSEFQIQVWRGLQLIPYGETRSYGELARAIGQPRASRAVGLANHENSIAIVIPCHRVIGAGGALVGYGGGVARKKWLLDHETRFAHPVGRTGDLFPSMSDAGSPYRTSVAAAPPGGMTPRTPNATGSAKSGARGANPKTTHATLAARSPARGTALKTAHMAAAARSPARGAVTRKTPRATAAPKSGARAARAAPRAPVRRRRG
jgi:O-6-methylguanine DNA methyltransferase